jgi:PPOX class probable F420-dependent enzyme
MKPLSDESKALLDAPNIAHLSTLMEDGSPKTEPVWIGREGDRVFITTDRKSIKATNIDRDPRVALSVADANNPYRQLLIRGRVVETRPDDDLVGMDALSQKYLGQPMPRRRWSGRLVLVIEPHVSRYYESPLAQLWRPPCPPST